MLRVNPSFCGVTDAEACRRFWIEQVGMEPGAKGRRLLDRAGRFRRAAVRLRTGPACDDGGQSPRPRSRNPPLRCTPMTWRQLEHNFWSMASRRWRSASTAGEEFRFQRPRGSLVRRHQLTARPYSHPTRCLQLLTTSLWPDWASGCSRRVRGGGTPPVGLHADVD